MIDTDELVDNLVALLRDIPELVMEMDGDATRIFAYHDDYPQRPSVEDAVHDMPMPGIMAAYQGFAKSSLGSVTVWAHRVVLYLRAKRYAPLFQLIAKGVPTSTGMPMDNVTVHPSCDVMDMQSSDRKADAEGLDYFEVVLSFTEIGDD